MNQVSREFQIFTKPVGGECNLQCSYCYYLEKKDLFPPARLLMRYDVLEACIIQHMEASTEPVINFSWHGGEPLMAGLDFYKKVSGLQKKHCPSQKSVSNGIQTNGTLLNEAWGTFFKKENYNVGISIDGPENLHNLHRLTTAGRSVFWKVLRGYKLLQKIGIQPEILCVVNAGNVNHPLDVYNFFKGLGVKYISFLPLVEMQKNSPTGASKDSVPAKGFGEFLITIFDEWVQKDIGTVKIQIFEEAARTAFDQDHTLCIFKENCGGIPVLEHNGDFYSCDHYVNADNLVGNIMNASLAEFLDSDKQHEFGMAKSLTLPGYCIECEVKAMCNGECPKNRFIGSPDGEAGLNYLCDGYKLFFNHCRPFIKAIRTAWRSSGVSD